MIQKGVPRLQECECDGQHGHQPEGEASPARARSCSNRRAKAHRASPGEWIGRRGSAFRLVASPAGAKAKIAQKAKKAENTQLNKCFRKAAHAKSAAQKLVQGVVKFERELHAYDLLCDANDKQRSSTPMKRRKPQRRQHLLAIAN